MADTIAPIMGYFNMLREMHSWWV